MSVHSKLRLGVNIDHVATIRNARESGWHRSECHAENYIELLAETPLVLREWGAIPNATAAAMSAAPTSP